MSVERQMTVEEMRQKLQEYLDESTPEQLRADLERHEHKVLHRGKLIPISKLPWWRKDRYGWPIETFKGRRFASFTRLVCQNIRKFLP